LDSCIKEPPTPKGGEERKERKNPRPLKGGRKKRKNPRPLKGGKKEKNGCPG